MPYETIAEAKKDNFPTTKDGIALTIAQVNRLAEIYDAIKEGGNTETPMTDAWKQWEAEYKKEDEKWVKMADNQYNCECLECGHKMQSDQHCMELECPKCGGEMRRAERPGVGMSTYAIELSVDAKNLPVKFWVDIFASGSYFKGEKKIDISERNVEDAYKLLASRLIDDAKVGVYAKAEHRDPDPKAKGWLHDCRLKRKNGRLFLQGYHEPNKWGRELLENKAFSHISCEIPSGTLARPDITHIAYTNNPVIDILGAMVFSIDNDNNKPKYSTEDSMQDEKEVLGIIDSILAAFAKLKKMVTGGEVEEGEEEQMENSQTEPEGVDEEANKEASETSGTKSNKEAEMSETKSKKDTLEMSVDELEKREADIVARVKADLERQHGLEQKITELSKAGVPPAVIEKVKALVFSSNEKTIKFSDEVEYSNTTDAFLDVLSTLSETGLIELSEQTNIGDVEQDREVAEIKEAVKEMQAQLGIEKSEEDK